MKKTLLIFILINLNNFALGSVKENIINNLISTKNLTFKFEQNINGNIEKGNCRNAKNESDLYRELSLLKKKFL